MAQEQVQSIIDTLRHVRRYPHMYIKEDIQHLISFMTGFRFGCAACGLQQDETVYSNIVISHGWKSGAEGHWSQMIQAGKDHQYIIEEVINIEIEAWQHTYLHK